MKKWNELNYEEARKVYSENCERYRYRGIIVSRAYNLIVLYLNSGWISHEIGSVYETGNGYELETTQQKLNGMYNRLNDALDAVVNWLESPEEAVSGE